MMLTGRLYSLLIFHHAVKVELLLLNQIFAHFRFISGHFASGSFDEISGVYCQFESDQRTTIVIGKTGVHYSAAR